MLNGVKWNGKGYNIKGNEDYELKNGKGCLKLYYPDGKVLIEGEYLNGKLNGKGKEYYPDGTVLF